MRRSDLILLSVLVCMMASCTPGTKKATGVAVLPTTTSPLPLSATSVPERTIVTTVLSTSTVPVSTITSTTVPVTTFSSVSANGRVEVLAAFDRYVRARRTGDLAGAVGSAQYRLRNARNDSGLAAREVWIDRTSAAVRACTESDEERLVTLTSGTGTVLSVVQVMAPLDARWCK
jgi:hypothetical protein